MKNPLKEIGRALSWHKERHRPSGFSFSIADSIDFLDADKWDMVTAGKSFFLGRRYLQALESTAPGNMSLRYALIFDGKSPVAATVMQLVDIGADRVTKKKGAEKLSKMQAKALVCGNLFSWGQHGVAFSSATDPVKVWAGVAEALYRVRQAEKLSGKTDIVMVKDLDASAQDVRALEHFSYKAVETDPDMVLEIDPSWRTFDDYLASLQSKYRKNALKIVKDLQQAGCTIELLEDWRKESARIHDLYLQVHAAAAVRPVTATDNYLAALADAAGSSMRCALIRRGSDILGFVTTIKESEETAIGYHIGFNRALKQELPLYFALLQTVVSDAIELGCKRLSLGRTALEPKAKLGAKPRPTNIWVRHTNPIANMVVRQLVSMVPHDEAPERSPFRGNEPPTLPPVSIDK